jgi:tetratricopeptide (TPR) repeat protein
MGEVYLVEHSGSGDLRAAKVIRVRRDATDADLVGFRREALALLNAGTHPFIVRFFDIHEQARDTVLVMEYVAPVSGCTTVQDYIARTQDYTDRTIGIWAVQFSVGMEHALSCGMVAHRDIKPGNLLIDSGAFLKIADFGVALALSHHSDIVDGAPRKPSQLQRLQAANGRLICGTPGYIAPELFMGGAASPQSDMFSFGVTLWQMAARSLTSPYAVRFAGDAVAYQRAILPKAVAHAVTRIDSPYFEVIRRCLAPDPAHRYPDFPTLREAIKNAAKAAKLGAVDFIVGPGFRGSFEEYVNRGRSYIVLGRYERALRILDEAVKHNPRSPGALLVQAEALIHRGQPVPAVRACESAHRLDPDADAPLTGMASAWLALGKPAQARAALEQVLVRHPTNLEARLLLARVLGEEGSAPAALSEAEKVLAADPHDWRARDHLGRALRALGKLADARKAFDTCLRINPLALDTRLALASLLTHQKELAAADAEYRQAVRLFQDNPETLNKIAAHMAEYGHAKQAIELFQALADSSPESRSIMMVNIGNAQLQLGDSGSAVASYRQAIQIEPTNALAYSRLGDLENDSARYDKAAGYFAHACALDPQNPTHHASAGTAYLQQEDYDRAAAYLRRSIELFPEQPLILYNHAVSLVFSGKAEAAVDELAKAVRIDEAYARGWYLKAQIESRLGRATEAAASARRAAENTTSLSADELEGVRALLP